MQPSPIAAIEPRRTTPRAIEKRMLQICVAVAAVIPVAAGLYGVVDSGLMIDGLNLPRPADSHFRYLSGLLLAIGVAFWSTIPAIERRRAPFQLLAAIVVAGGIGRLISLIVAGTPNAPMLAALAMELGVVPALALWQARVARNARRAG